MHVQVHHRLAGDLTRVEADVVALRSELLVELALYFRDELEEGALFLGSGLEPGGDFAARDDEGVALGDWVLVADGEGSSEMPQLTSPRTSTRSGSVVSIQKRAASAIFNLPPRSAVVASGSSAP